MQHGPRMLRTGRILIIIVRVMFSPWNLGNFLANVQRSRFLHAAPHTGFNAILSRADQSILRQISRQELWTKGERIMVR